MNEELFSGVLPFFAAAEEQGFRRAARRLGVTPAAVSKAVARLEERVGMPLMVRTTRAVSLTPEGVVFLEHCRQAIASLQAGREQLSAARRQPRGELHISASYILGPVMVPELPRLAVRHPHLAFRMTLTDRLVRLAEEGVDVAVRVGALADSRLVSRRLRNTRWITLCAPSVVARHGTPTRPEELQRFNALRFVAPDGRPRDWVFREPKSGASTAMRVQGNFLVDQGERLVDAAVAGLGVCQVLDFMARGERERGALVELLPNWSAGGPPLHAVTTAARARTPNVRAFMAFLGETFARA